jgi:hypothetical protein
VEVGMAGGHDVIGRVVEKNREGDSHKRARIQQ